MIGDDLAKNETRHHKNSVENYINPFYNKMVLNTETFNDNAMTT